MVNKQRQGKTNYIQKHIKHRVAARKLTTKTNRKTVPRTHYKYDSFGKSVGFRVPASFRRK